MKTGFFAALFMFFALACCKEVKALFVTNNFEQAGSLETTTATFIVREVFNNTGRVVAHQAVECICGIIRGNGHIAGPTITITAKEFQFSGVIECSGSCVITTENAFDPSTCTFTGDGTFEFIVDPHAFEQAMQKVSKGASVFSPGAQIPVSITVPQTVKPVWRDESVSKKEEGIRASIYRKFTKALDENKATKEQIRKAVKDLKAELQKVDINNRVLLQSCKYWIDVEIFRYKDVRKRSYHALPVIFTAVLGIGILKNPYPPKDPVEKIMACVAGSSLLAVSSFFAWNGIVNAPFYQKKYENLIFARDLIEKELQFQ